MSVRGSAATDLHESARVLLGSVEELLKTHRELARLRGENFNVFQLLDMEHDEDRLHSRFIAELLDPRGSHQQQDIFLRLFLEQILEPLDKGRKDWIETDKASVVREKYVGPREIRDEDSTGGLIDIFVTDNRRHLSIENKIGSGEGDKQVTRYCNYDEDNNFVLFLSPDGKSARTDKTNYRAISYREHILPWLEECHRRVADSPILRETLKQYIITVRRLTGRLTMDTAEERLMKLIAEHVSAARAIHGNYDRLLTEKLRSLVSEVKANLEQNDLIVRDAASWSWEVPSDVRGSYARLSIRRSEWGETCVAWEGTPHLANGSCYGVMHHRDKPGRKDRESWKDELLGKDPSLTRRTTYWPHYGALAEALFQTDDQIGDLFYDQKRKELANVIACKLFKLVEFCDSRIRRSS